MINSKFKKLVSVVPFSLNLLFLFGCKSKIVLPDEEFGMTVSKYSDVTLQSEMTCDVSIDSLNIAEDKNSDGMYFTLRIDPFFTDSCTVKLNESKLKSIFEKNLLLATAFEQRQELLNASFCKVFGPVHKSRNSNRPWVYTLPIAGLFRQKL